MMIKFIIVILFSLIFSIDINCEKEFFKSNEISLNKNFFYIKAYLDTTNSDSLNMFIQKNKGRNNVVQ